MTKMYTEPQPEQATEALTYQLVSHIDKSDDTDVRYLFTPQGRAITLPTEPVTDEDEQESIARAIMIETYDHVEVNPHLSPDRCNRCTGRGRTAYGDTCLACGGTGKDDKEVA